MRKCPICKKRGGKTRHAKNGIHADTRAENNVMLCFWCHQAMNIINKHKEWDWDFLMKNKRKEIIKQADLLIQRDKERKERLRR